MSVEKDEGCLVCHRSWPAEELRPLASVGTGVLGEIRRDLGAFPADASICRADVAHYRRRYVERLLEAERGELGALDREVLASLEAGETVAQNILATERRTLGERAADGLASFGGSWTFILVFGVVLFGWMALNASWLLLRPFDPYPFILLNLVLSTLAALQAPVIMMSQRRQEARDRLRAENDYKVNLKAELEIRHLHEKIDHQLARQWERLAEIQRIQVEMLEEVTEGGRG
jgi:uncharacterized membrane protein